LINKYGIIVFKNYFFLITFLYYEKKENASFIIIKVLFGTDVGVPVVCPCTGEVYIAADSNASLCKGLRFPREVCVMLLVSTTGGGKLT